MEAVILPKALSIIRIVRRELVARSGDGADMDSRGVEEALFSLSS
jgi:hypothetical protein